MAQISDSDRLDFMLEKRPELDHNWQTGEHWVVYNTEVYEVRRKVISYGKSDREAIDQAILGIFVVVD